MGLFDNLKFRSRPALLSGEEDEPVRAEASEILASELKKWANEKVCLDTFIPHLDSLIAAADFEESENLASHIKIAYHKGQRDALKALKEEFTFWSDKR